MCQVLAKCIFDSGSCRTWIPGWSNSRVCWTNAVTCRCTWKHLQKIYVDAAGLVRTWGASGSTDNKPGSIWELQQQLRKRRWHALECWWQVLVRKWHGRKHWQYASECWQHTWERRQHAWERQRQTSECQQAWKHIQSLWRSKWKYHLLQERCWCARKS